MAQLLEVWRGSDHKLSLSLTQAAVPRGVLHNNVINRICGRAHLQWLHNSNECKQLISFLMSGDDDVDNGLV